MIRVDILEKEDLIRQWINDDISKAEICKRLSCGRDTIERYLKKMNIEYNGSQFRKKNKSYRSSLYMPFEEYIKKSNKVQTNKIRQKLFKEKLKEEKCEKCGNIIWNDMPIPLEVHHKDGNKENNQLDNLEILCPNCHAQTDSYRGRNCKKT